VATDPAWVERASADIARVLVDHAHCEMKAASNALSLSVRCVGHASVTRALVEIAEEELRHFRRVLEELERRGIELGPPEEDWYAAELRRRIAKRSKPRGIDAIIVDRLLVGALIEARSCERFKLLATAMKPRDADLAAFYEELFAEEARHHRTFCDLAQAVAKNEGLVRSRLAELAAIEAEVVRDLPGAPSIHG
jgi:tRNA-(ms[2]io[6]A)-hydroxylase